MRQNNQSENNNQTQNGLYNEINVLLAESQRFSTYLLPESMIFNLLAEDIDDVLQGHRRVAIDRLGDEGELAKRRPRR